MNTDGLSRRTVAFGAAFRVLLGAAVIAMLILVALIAVQVQGTVDATRSAQKSALASQERLIDCTDPSGKCFRDAAERQASIVGEPPAPINDVVILAAACADRAGVDTETEIRDCVLAGLAG